MSVELKMSECLPVKMPEHELIMLIKRVQKEYEKQFAGIKNDEKLMKFILGKVMSESNGRADPMDVRRGLGAF